MKLLQVKRKTKTKKYYSKKMGMLTTNVTYIKKYFVGLPITTLHEYRKTYYGEVKKSEDCFLLV